MKKKNLSKRTKLSRRSNVLKIGNTTPSKKLIFIMVGVLFIFISIGFLVYFMSNKGNSASNAFTSNTDEAITVIQMYGGTSIDDLDKNKKPNIQVTIVDANGRDKNGNIHSADQIITEYNLLIDNNQFKLSKEYDSTLGYAIFYGENPSFIIQKTIEQLNSCSEYKNMVNAIIAETQRNKLKPYIYGLDKNVIEKMDKLVTNCYRK